MSAFSSLLNYMNDYLSPDYKFPKHKSKKYNIYKVSPKPAQGRNEKCNCGSGLKFKKCCGKEV